MDGIFAIDRVSRRRARVDPDGDGGPTLEGQKRFVFRTKQLHIVAGETLLIWADGERLTQTPVTIEVAAAAVLVMLPGSVRISAEPGVSSVRGR